jgi:hypothetical protein
MATKSMGYDNAAYLAVHQDNMGTVAAGSGAVSDLKITAFANALVKSMVARISTAGTSADVLNLVVISGTTTTTTPFGTTGSAATGFVYYPAPSTLAPLAQGDFYWAQKGTDATLAYAGTTGGVSIERVVQPLANVTV